MGLRRTDGRYDSVGSVCGCDVELLMFSNESVSPVSSQGGT